MRLQGITGPDYLRMVRALPCIACEIDNACQTSETEAHHIKRRPDGTKCGMGERKTSDFYAIPLCRLTHHWNGVDVHMSQRWFESRYGNELELAMQTRERLGLARDAEDATL